MAMETNMTPAEPETNISNTRKRNFSGDDEEPARKILIENEKVHSLLSLSDEILLEIFKHLDGNTLFALGSACTRLYNLISDRRLWKEIDLLSEPLMLNQILYRLRHMNHETIAVKFRGSVSKQPLNSWNNVTLSPSLLNKISEKCPKLGVLGIYEGFINLEKVAISDFPSTLKTLIFNRCSVGFLKVPNVFFTRIDVYLQDLQELVLEKCNWFETHDLVVFSKIPNLKKLSLKGCLSLKDCVPYGSIATRFGFKTLEYLDVRDTPISDSDIQCFNITLTLRTLLMECPEHLREIPCGPNCQSSSRSSPTIATAPTQLPDVVNRLVRENSGEQRQENLIHVVLNDRSVINLSSRPIIFADRRDEIIRANFMNNNERSPEQDAERIAPMVHRALSRSLWFERNYPPPFSPPRAFLISDRGICSFGFPRNPVRQGIVWIRAEARPPDTYLEKLVIRHYKRVTDISLSHLAQCTPNLVYLDLTGTSVTKEGVRIFKDKKPSCYIVSDHFTG